MNSTNASSNFATRVGRRLFLDPAVRWGAAERIGAAVVIAGALGYWGFERSSARGLATGWPLDVAVTLGVVLAAELLGYPRLGRLLGLLTAAIFIAVTLRHPGLG
ncbi:MAG: hypothetical protein ACRD2E_13745 [Terriglobales bacterium]